MDENTKLIITLKQLKELRKSEDMERKIEIYADVLSQPYREKSAVEIIVGRTVKGAGALIDAIDKATEPTGPPKKRGGGL